MATVSDAPAKKPVFNLSAAIASVGVVVEFYDFVLFGYLTAVWAVEFFPSDNDTLALIFVWSTFAIGMAVRPLGGLLFGFLGTKYGRRFALRISIVMMSVPMLVTALIPGFATIGIIAPLLFILMRVVQGLSIGGEYSGSIVYLVEDAPANRRGFVSNVSGGASGIGAALAGTVVLVLSLTLTDDQLNAWGWRVAYLFGAAMVMVAILMRSRMKESEYFEKAKAAGEIPRTPVRDAFRSEWRRILIGIVISGYAVAAFYFSLTYLPSFLEKLPDSNETNVLLFGIISSLILGVTSQWFGGLSDIYGRRPVMIVSALALAAMGYPVFVILGEPQMWNIWVGGLALLIPVMAFWGGFSPAIAELFSSEHRFAAVGITYNLGAATLGGTVGVIVTALTAKFGTVWGPVIYLVPFSVIAAFLCWKLRETAFTPLGSNDKSAEPELESSAA